MSPGHIDRTSSTCVATREVFDRIGDKWSLLVIFTLRDRSVRFNEMKRQIEGISQRMLTLTLRSLERDGLLKRTVYPSVPVRVDYELTPLGRSLIAPVTALAEWAHVHINEIEGARQRFDKKSSKPGIVKALISAARR